ncbi:MAG: hypothetical protein V1897_17255 [Pseudomonadota bacterium]
MAALDRSEIIDKFEAYILQGSVDDLWGNEEKNDLFHNALDLISDEIITAGLPYYKVQDASLSAGADDLYALPDACRSLDFVWDSAGNAIHPMSSKYRKDGNFFVNQEAFCLVNHKIRLLGFSTTPAIVIDYTKFPNYIGDWDGTADNLQADYAADPTAYQPEAPLNSERGARLIAKVMAVLARVKDEGINSGQQTEIETLVRIFCDRLGGMRKTGLKIIGTRGE